jgi:metallophosphoesterase (TIGR00282 family)
VRLLFVGDVVGAPGRRILRRVLPGLKRDSGAALAVVNGENAAGGAGITRDTSAELFAAGADVVTTGNHVWDKREALSLLAQEPRILRPANYPDPCPGGGLAIVSAGGIPVAVVNVMGRVFMPLVDDPFRALDRILGEIGARASVVLVDVHAEATSEKIALGWYLDGRVTAIVGTHTHVATADARILPGGTAYITDAGMTGPHDSVIGVRKEQVLERFLSQRPLPYETAENDVRLSGVLIDADENTGRATAIERVEVPERAAEGER